MNRSAQKKRFRVLAINPGSTSTKVAVYEEEELLYEASIQHSRKDIDACGPVVNQNGMRRGVVLRALEEAGVPVSSLDAVVGRGGLVDPIDSGTYLINDRMLRDLVHSAASVHASSLGAIIAWAGGCGGGRAGASGH